MMWIHETFPVKIELLSSRARFMCTPVYSPLKLLVGWIAWTSESWRDFRHSLNIAFTFVWSFKTSNPPFLWAKETSTPEIKCSSNLMQIWGHATLVTKVIGWGWGGIKALRFMPKNWWKTFQCLSWIWCFDAKCSYILGYDGIKELS